MSVARKGGWLLMLTAPAASPAGDPARIGSVPTSTAPDARPILQAASELALQQGERERFWTDTALLQIGELQTRAGDFTGALRSLRRVNDTFRRNCGLLHLVEA